MPKKKVEPKKDMKAEQRDRMFEKSVKANNKNLKQISDLVAQHEAKMGEYGALIKSADEIWGKILELERRDLPAAFAEAGTSSFTDEGSGAVLEVDSYISGTWPKDDKGIKKATAWLKKIKAENLIKSELIGKFSRKDVGLARKFAAQIQKGGKAVVELKERVHPQTLLAFFRERLKAGKEVPFDIFNGETGTFVRVDYPKENDAQKDGK